MLSPVELFGVFHVLFNRKMAEAYTWDLWVLPTSSTVGVSDDGFAYFRAWLISRGQSVYSAALRDADSLSSIVDVDRDHYEFEDLWGIAQVVYEDTTESEMPADDSAWPAEPAGDRWEFDDKEQLWPWRLPRLVERYA